MKFAFALLAALPIAVSALAPTPVSTDDVPSFNPVGVTFNPLVPRADAAAFNPLNVALKPLDNLAAAAPAPTTNAERLARGLPLLAPKKRHAAKSRVARHGHPAAAAPSAAPPTHYGGSCGLHNAQTGELIGHVKRDLNEFAEFTLTLNIEEALHIEFSASADNSPFDITHTDSIISSLFPFFGGIVGVGSSSSSLHIGSANYVYLGATQSAPALSPAALIGSAFSAVTSLEAHVQSSFWRFEAGASALVPTWINEDSAEAETHLLWYPGGNSLVLTADVAAFTSQFEGAVEVNLVLHS